ncbi:hypothetical protein [Rufibacter immobilis]|uniref:hypothetical protein n=1 Tax=Rufibacter immobilis TaxID=1348778 RepID=UPI0035E59513
MIATTQEEEKNKRIAMGVSLAVHALLLLFLFFFLVGQRPDPELDQLGGIEMSFGTTETGGGDVHSKAQPNDSPNEEDSQPAAESPKATPTPQPQPQPEVTAQPEKVVSTTMEAPVSVKEEPKPKVVEQPKVEEKKVDTRALMGKAKTGAGNGVAGSSNQPTGNNNGDEGTVGDKGNPAGMYPGKKTGKGGSGGGSLDMPGWRYDIEPRPDPYENESGIIKFRIKIDGDGELVSLQVVEYSVSPQVVEWYKKQVQRTSFSRINNSSSSAGATGTITFIIKSN